MKRQVLILTSEMIPGLGVPTAGGGVRIHALGEGLRSAGHEVIFSLPEELVAKIPDEKSEARDALRKHAHPMHRPTDAVHRVAPDVLLVEQWFPLSELEKVDCPIVVDLPGPLILENLFRGVGDLHSNACTKLRALSSADAFIYSNPRQKAWWLAWLVLAGLDLNRDPLLHVPICRSPNLPSLPTLEAGARFIHGGVFWPWQNPTQALRILKGIMEERGEGKIAIFGGRHPHHTVSGEVYYDPTEHLPPGERVEYHPMMPLEELEKEYARGSIALELSAPNVERELASSIRTIGFLHCGLPILINSQSYLAEEIREYGAGWVVDTGNPGEMERVFRRVFEEKETWGEKSRAAQRLASEKYIWDRAIVPLAAYCEKPWHPERSRTFLENLRNRMESLVEENRALQDRNTEQEARIRDLDARLEDAVQRLQKRLRSRIAQVLRKVLGAGN